MLIATLIFLAAVAVAVFGGRNGLRGLVALAVVLSPMRGGLLEIADRLSLSDPGVTVNSIVPGLVAAVAIGVLFQKRPKLDDFPRPLLIIWGLIAVAVALSFLDKTVSMKLYGIGVAQYLVYPTLALAVWPLIEPGDGRRLTRLIIATGGVVAVTVLLQAMGIEGFIQAASAQVDGFAANRYAGITGSYLHTSSFLGVTAVLAMGEFAGFKDWRTRLAGTVVLAAILSGEVLTFSRSGIVIALIGVIALFLFAVAGRRLSFAIMVVPAIAIAIASGMIGGVAPEAAGGRVASGFNPSDDPGNKLRSESFEKGWRIFRDAPIVNQGIGHGAASTGNAQQLVDEDQPPTTVESYYLKLLVETGVVGLILIGAFLIWAIVMFSLSLLKRPDPWFASIAAAGLGLSLYNAIYPALETQILALAWWLLLTLFLKYRDAEGDEPSTVAPERADVSDDALSATSA
ncbi:MAG TPA: O-antigen ligase family protein [Solirubrobacterales bacterium]